MQLSYVAKRVTEWGLRVKMDDKQLRSYLIEHFSSRLEELKAQVDAAGPLTKEQIDLLQTTSDVLDMELNDGFISPEQQDRLVQEFINKYDIDLMSESPLYPGFKRKLAQAHRAYLKAAIAYSGSAETFDFETVQALAPLPVAVPAKPKLPLNELVRQYWEHRRIESRWSPKSEGEYEKHIQLLYERFGAEMDASAFGVPEAREMREILQRSPVNRSKRKETRGKSLDTVLGNYSGPTLSLRTINKYMTTYSGLFTWAAREGLCNANPFAGLLFSDKGLDKEEQRQPFSKEEIEKILKSLLSENSGYSDHHKWGALLGVFTGARLNEIAQLYIEDVITRDDILCIDINKKPGTNKRLKTASSKRVVPLHPRLLEYGFVEYFDRIKSSGAERLFPEFTYSKSDGYGRNLGRWTNESLLPRLGIKRKELTFHSFRHTMVHRLTAAGVQQPHVMAIVGHEQGTTTLDTYNRAGFPPRLLLSALEQFLVSPALPRIGD